MKLTKSSLYGLLTLLICQNLFSQCPDNSQVAVYTSSELHTVQSTLREEQGFSMAGFVEEAGGKDYVLYQFTDELNLTEAIKISSDLNDEGDPVIHERLSNGNYVIAGYTRINSQRFLKIVCFDESTVLWQKRLEGNLEIARALKALDSGGVLLVGSSNTDTNGATDAFAIEFDQDGNVVWKKGFGSADNEHFYAAENSFDGLRIAGGNNKTYTGTHRPVLATIDNLGNLVEYNVYTGAGLALFTTITKYNNTYYAGGFTEASFARGIIVALDLNFEILWSKQVELNGYSDNVLNGVGMDDDGSLYASVYGEGTNPKLHYLKINPANGDLISAVTTTTDIPSQDVMRIGGFQLVQAESGMLTVSNDDTSGDFIVIGTNECLSNSTCLESADISLLDYDLTKVDVSPGERILQDVFDIDQFTVSTIAAPLAEPCGLVCQGELLLEDITVCLNQEINLSYQLNNETSPVSSWSWDFGNGQSGDVESPIVSYIDVGVYEYSLELSTNDGCEYSAMGSIEVVTSPESPTIDNQVILCDGETFEMNSSDFPGWQILDSDGNLITEFSTQTSGVYSFEFVSNCGQETVEVEVLSVDAGALNFDDIGVCTGEVVTVSIDDFEEQFPDADLIVDDGTGSTENFTGVYTTIYQTSGVYPITVSGTMQGCEVIESIDVLVENPVSSFLEDEFEFCSNESLELNFENLDFEVYDADGNLTVFTEIQESGTFVFIGENGCSEFTEVIEVTEIPFHPEPLPLFQTICPGRDTAAIGFANNEYLYQWQNDSQDSVINVMNRGIHEVFVTDLSEQCSQNYLFQVSETPYQPVNIFEFPQIDICLEGQNTVIFPFQYAPYIGRDGSEIPLRYEATETEVLYFSYTDGCYTYNDSVLLSVEPCLCSVYVPNAFSPNQDGLNDLFRPSLYCPVYDYRMLIFDRGGRKVFESNQIDIPWRGESPRDDYYAHDGVYLYRIRFSQELDGLRYPTELQGTVTLLR